MSFGAERIEIMTEIRTIRNVIDFEACFPVLSTNTCDVTSKTGKGAFVSIIAKSSLSSRLPIVSS